MAQGMELLDNGTKVFTGPGAAFGTDALLLARFAMPRRKETALDLCSGCGIVALAWARCRAPWPMHSGGAGCRCFGPVPPCCAGNAGCRAYYRSLHRPADILQKRPGTGEI